MGRTRRVSALAAATFAVFALPGCSVEFGSAPASAPAVTSAPTRTADVVPDPEGELAKRRVNADALRVGVNLDKYYTLHGRYPKGGAAGLVERLDDEFGLQLAEGSRVAAYSAASSTFTVCVVSEDRGAWAAYDSVDGGVVDTGYGGAFPPACR